MAIRIASYLLVFGFCLQIAQSNAYSLNRGLPFDKNKAIINTYLDLQKQLPAFRPLMEKHLTYWWFSQLKQAKPEKVTISY